MALQIPSSGDQPHNNSTKTKFSNSKTTNFLFHNAHPTSPLTKTVKSALLAPPVKFLTSEINNAQTAKLKRSTFKRHTSASKSTKSPITTQATTGSQPTATANPSITNFAICKTKTTPLSSALQTDLSPRKISRNVLHATKTTISTLAGVKIVTSTLRWSLGSMNASMWQKNAEATNFGMEKTVLSVWNQEFMTTTWGAVFVQTLWSTTAKLDNACPALLTKKIPTHQKPIILSVRLPPQASSLKTVLSQNPFMIKNLKTVSTARYHRNITTTTQASANNAIRAWNSVLTRKIAYYLWPSWTQMLDQT